MMRVYEKPSQEISPMTRARRETKAEVTLMDCPISSWEDDGGAVYDMKRAVQSR